MINDLNKKRLNVFIIPSWYPSGNDNVSGIFVKEQVLAISNFRKNIFNYVSCWGHQSGHLSLRNPIQTLKALFWRVSNFRSKVFKHSSNYIEIFTPSLSWSSELPSGGHKSILSVNRRNLRKVEKLNIKIDVIHAHVAYPAGVVAYLLSKEFKIPFIITEHLGPTRLPAMFFYNGKLNNIILNTYRNASSVIAVSEFLKNELFKLKVNNTIIIPNLVNEDVFHPSFIKKDKFTFFTLCLISKGKGIDLLLRAISQLIQSLNNIEFWIGGDGPELNYYKQYSKQLGISQYIKWLGEVDRSKAPILFQNCNAFVLPSKYETFGVVFAEAIACGKPIISTKCGGPESIVTENNGLLVDLGSEAQLTDAMKYMVANSDKFSSEKIRVEFLRNFSRRVVVDKIVDVYLNLFKK